VAAFRLRFFILLVRLRGSGVFGAARLGFTVLSPVLGGGFGDGFRGRSFRSLETVCGAAALTKNLKRSSTTGRGLSSRRRLERRRAGTERIIAACPPLFFCSVAEISNFRLTLHTTTGFIINLDG
jgi:hypothetical protein